MRKRSGQVHSRESSATLQLTVSLLYQNSKTTMDIYAKVKYNKLEELFGVVNGAFHQAIAE